MGSSSRMGCEYRYCFSAEDEIISKYSWYELIGKRYVFEIRTNFIVKGRFANSGVDNEKVGSEVFSLGLFEDENEQKEKDMSFFLGTRLRDYWMSDDEVGEFTRKALSFAYDLDQNGREMIPIGVDIDVCSVQQEGEPISATLGRAIKPECLYPIYLCPWVQGTYYSGGGGDPSDINLMIVLRHLLPTARVVDDDAEECVVCLCRPIVGSQVTTLECGHAFHHHCIAKWLASKDTCPTCRHQAHDAFNQHLQWSKR